MSVATQSPTSNAAETGAGLTNPNNANSATDDNTYATALPGKNVTLATKYQNFGFDAVLDAAAIITKVQIIYQYKVSVNTSIATARTYAKVTGVSQGNHDDATEQLSDTTNTIDITGDRSWTRANLLDGTFECVLSAVQGNSSTAVTFSFDFVKVEVTYTVPVAPTVTTQAVSNIDSQTATGNGNVTSDGGGTITERGIVWKLTTGPTTSDFKATSAGTTGAYTASLTSLSVLTHYYVKAYAINSVGTSYGSEVEFDTIKLPVMLNNYQFVSAGDGLSVTEKIK